MKESGHLRAVSDREGPAETATRATNEQKPNRLARTLIVAGLVVGFLALAAGWFSAHQRALALEAKLSAVSGQLAATESALEESALALDARRSHSERVRDGVAALASELRALTSILDEDPESAPAGQ